MYVWGGNYPRMLIQLWQLLFPKPASNFAATLLLKQCSVSVCNKISPIFKITVLLNIIVQTKERKSTEGICNDTYLTEATVTVCDQQQN